MAGMNGKGVGGKSITGRRGRRLFTAGAVVLGLLASAGGVARADVVLAEKRSWQPRASTDHECTSSPLTFNGPGVVSVRLKMSPYQAREFPTWREEIVTHGLPDLGSWLGFSFLEGTPGGYGKPVDVIFRWLLRGTKTSTDFRICNPVKCNGAGFCSQHGATANIIVDFAPGADANTKLEPPELSMDDSAPDETAAGRRAGRVHGTRISGLSPSRRMAAR